MKFLNKLERKIGRYAIPNLTAIMIGCFVVGYVLQVLAPEIYGKILFIPYFIQEFGEWWRLFTWIFTTPFSLNIFTVLALFFYFSLGRQLEMTWGKFLYNLYIFSGLLFITVGVMVAQIICYNMGYIYIVYIGATQYLVLSMYLAYASVYPETVIYFCFIIPIKIKWIAYADLILLAYKFIAGDLFSRIVIATCVLNFFVYYFVASRRSKLSLKQKRRQLKYRSQVRRGNASAKKKENPKRVAAEEGQKDTEPVKKITHGKTVHKCAICGRTEMDSDDLEFRFCSKCNGNYEYCNEHLFTHEHVK